MLSSRSSLGVRFASSALARSKCATFPAYSPIALNENPSLRSSTAFSPASVANRTRLLILSEPTELYNNPDFGVGLKRYLWKYNNEATRGMVKDRITAQLRLHEPSVEPDKTKYVDGLLFSGEQTTNADHPNTLALTVALQTIFKEEAEVKLNSDPEGNIT